jgi:hypothetical protein
MGPGYGSSSGGCSADELAGLKLEIENLGKIRQFPYAGNLRCIIMVYMRTSPLRTWSRLLRS